MTYLVPACPKCGAERVRLAVLHVDAPGSLERAQAGEAVRWRPREGRWQPKEALSCGRCASREYLLPPDWLPLRDYLARQQAAAYLWEAAAQGVLAEVLPVELSEHVSVVLERVERLAGTGPARRPLLLLAAIHDEPPDKTFGILEAAGMVDQAPAVASLRVGFGAIWRVEGERALEEYVRLNAHLLQDLLLFEVAHEGGATEMIRQAGRRVGLGDSVNAWEQALS